MSSRRQFLTALAASAAACRVTPTGQPGTAATASTDLDSLAAAEKVLGIEHTPAEREQIAATLDEQLGLVASRRGHPLPNELAPATVFDPRLPGTAVPTSTTRAFPEVGEALPADDESIAFASVASLSKWIATKQITSRRLTELYLERLERIGPSLECVITLTRELALQQADRADKEIAAGKLRGPLHGIPWGAKDLFDTKGIKTTWGAKPYEDRVGPSDATVVQRLEAAGAVLVAKLSLGALAYGDLWFGGRTRNPWNPVEGSSGSSAGSASAVAAGLVGFALGTETLGSIVSPSMRCGVTGLRPTFGRVPRTGAMALCWSMDKVGPITRRVEDAAMVLAAIDGADPGDASSRDVPLALDLKRPLEGLKVGIIPGWFADPELSEPEKALPAVVKELGMELVELPSLPDLPYAAMLTVLYTEAAAAFETLMLDGSDDQLVWQDLNAWPNSFRRTRLLGAIEFVQGQRIRREVMGALAERFAQVDVMVGPSYAGGMLTITNMTGHPCLTIPAGFVERPPIDSLSNAPMDGDARSMPQGITVWGRLYDEGTLCRVGLALQEHYGVAPKRPPM
ncbi:MAG: amidase [Myxococcota bacterium]